MNVDWNRINSFITEDDEEEKEWLRDMIQTLITNYQERLSELDEIAKTRDNEKLISLLHQMKGITSNFGLEGLKEITIQAEFFSKAKDIDSALKESEKLELIWTETKAELKTKLGI